MSKQEFLNEIVYPLIEVTPKNLDDDFFFSERWPTRKLRDSSTVSGPITRTRMIQFPGMGQWSSAIIPDRISKINLLCLPIPMNVL